TNAASSPTKCTAMTAPPAAIGWMRSAMDGAEVGASLIRLRHALGESLADHLLGHVAADENGAAEALLAVLPRPLMIAVEDHVHALEDEAFGIVLERQDALAAQDLRPFLRHQVLDPGEELVGIERLVGPHRERLHMLVVIVFQPAMVVIVIMVMV